MKLTFLGAAGTVTGSKYLLEAGETKVLIDCGLFQGIKNLRRRNWDPYPIPPSELDAIVLSHAHIDHSGYLPVLLRDGFKGRVFCTPPTKDLCAILLPDSGHLQEEDARYASRKGYSRHARPEPLYTREDGERALRWFTGHPFDEPLQIGELTFRFRPAGHILGAASLRAEHKGTSVLFSGDLGRDDDLLMRPPARPSDPTYVVIESTYGERLHPSQNTLDALERAAKPCLERGGILLVPAFAVGRSQTLLYCLHRLFSEERLPRVPVYLNSPMATDVTHVYRRHTAYHRLAPDACNAVCDAANYVNSVEESKQLHHKPGPMVVISASGMLTGGRVLHHLKDFGPRKENKILLPGYQPPGTRGHALVQGTRKLKVHGKYVRVRAEVEQLEVFSAHADQDDLIAWLGACTRPPSRVFVTHGEPTASDALRLRIKDELGYKARTPEHGQQVELA